MICGIHYFSTELKTNLMSSQGAALKTGLFVYIMTVMQVDSSDKPSL